MRISTVRLAVLLGAAIGLGAVMGAHSDTYSGMGAYGAYVGPVGVEYADGAIAVWACPDSALARHLGCPVDMYGAMIRQRPMDGEPAEDTRDGGYLTTGMVERVRLESPGTAVDGCRWHDTGDDLVITCDDGTYLRWTA